MCDWVKSISGLHCLPNMTSSIPGLSGDVHDSIQNDLDFDPLPGGAKSGHFDPILGGWCYTKQCKFWRVSSVLIQGDSHFSGFPGGQNRPFSTPPGKGQNRPKSDIFDPPGTMPVSRVLTGSSQTCEKVMKMTPGEHGVSIMWRNVF